MISNCENTKCMHFSKDHSGNCGAYLNIQSCDTAIWKKTDPEIFDKQSPLSVQVGGSHYKDFPIQPIEYTHRNRLNFCQGNIIKYVSRYKEKNGKQDLEKAKHYIDLLIELEYSNEN